MHVQIHENSNSVLCFGHSSKRHFVQYSVVLLDIELLQNYPLLNALLIYHSNLSIIMLCIILSSILKAIDIIFGGWHNFILWLWVHLYTFKIHFSSFNIYLFIYIYLCIYVCIMIHNLFLHRFLNFIFIYWSSFIIICSSKITFSIYYHFFMVVDFLVGSFSIFHMLFVKFQYQNFSPNLKFDSWSQLVDPLYLGNLNMKSVML